MPKNLASDAVTAYDFIAYAIEQLRANEPGAALETLLDAEMELSRSVELQRRMPAGREILAGAAGRERSADEESEPIGVGSRVVVKSDPLGDTALGYVAPEVVIGSTGTVLGRCAGGSVVTVDFEGLVQSVAGESLAVL